MSNLAIIFVSVSLIPPYSHAFTTPRRSRSAYCLEQHRPALYIYRPLVPYWYRIALLEIVLCRYLWHKWVPWRSRLFFRFVYVPDAKQFTGNHASAVSLSNYCPFAIFPQGTLSDTVTVYILHRAFSSESSHTYETRPLVVDFLRIDSKGQSFVGYIIFVLSISPNRATYSLVERVGKLDLGNDFLDILLAVLYGMLEKMCSSFCLRAVGQS